MKKNIHIALLGYGHVGKGFYELFNRLRQSNLRIVAIAEREPGKLPPELRHLFQAAEQVVARKDIDIIVEATNTSSEAFGLVQTALQRGCRVVSANKKMLARHLQILEPYIAAGDLRYEAAACASLPVFRILETFYFEEPVNSIRGIFNGTCNYLLTRMESDPRELAELLPEAQRLGYAEADPTDDIDGHDTVYKLLLLIRSTWGDILKPSDVQRSGIRALRQEDVARARNNNRRLKLVAEARRENGVVEASVGVRETGPDDPLYHVSAENNILQVMGAWSGPQHYTGRGAGSLPTGKAMLQDVLDLAARHSFAPANLQK